MPHLACRNPGKSHSASGSLLPWRERRVLRDRPKAKSGYLDPYREFGPDVRVAARDLAPSRGSSAEYKDGVKTLQTPVQACAPSAGAARGPEVLPGRRAEPEGTIEPMEGAGQARLDPAQHRCNGGIGKLARVKYCPMMPCNFSARFFSCLSFWP